VDGLAELCTGLGVGCRSLVRPIRETEQSCDLYADVMLRGVLALLNGSPGHKREFSLTDTTIQHSFAEHERVPPSRVLY